MDLSEIGAIVGLPGLFKIVSKKGDGAVVSSLLDGRTQFVATRLNTIAPLETVTIYTTGEEDTVKLKQVFASIKQLGDKVPFPRTNEEKELKTWMEAILPNYDKEKVHLSDMKKLAKWYSLLSEKNLMDELLAEKTEDENAEDKEAKKETKPKVIKSDRSAKAHSKPAPVKKITTPRKAT